MEVIGEIFDKTEAAQYLRPLLTNHDQNLNKKSLLNILRRYLVIYELRPPWRSLLKLEASSALILAIHKVETTFDGEFIL